MTDENTKKLEEVMSEQSVRGKVLAVTSGKGGVGKTNIVANLSICLAVSGKKVVAMDADLGLGNLDVVMDISCKSNLGHVISGQKSLEEIIQVGPGGVDVICGGSGIEELANLNKFQRQRLLEELDGIQKNSDLIIIDNGAGISSSVVSFCLAADHTLVVTTPEPSAMTDAYAMIKVLAAHDYDGRISLVVNMARSVSEGKRVYRQISDVAMRFLDIPVYEAGVLCRTDKLVSAVRKRKPVVLAYPRSGITSSIGAMAARLSRGAAVKTKEGFFKRVANLFS
ncbi:Flagellum site-determining protein YlxH [Anaerohalosphaera lusitana]|uniref:Flagellum site-determining protein YlxH n=1 Tax=Anaerohalosphaera lusitana TaxID=1936003 RepID=A0A1U9NKE9_9BACT|nr:MinD/ParA family protein [Anaerohalosphaera lusitana]AQT68412.1 Flagellum site-determining protein YlxH [Anaerohalosphaera lusitana]